MSALPTILFSSVIRSSQRGDSHGGIYLVDLDKETSEKVFDWDNKDIDWTGRGGDRGLRGLEFYDGMIIAAASDEIFFLNQDFEIKERYQNTYLRHCHEISIEGDRLALSSTGYDSVLYFDLPTRRFTHGFCYRYKNPTKLSKFLRRIVPFYQMGYDYYAYDPQSDQGPELRDSAHINNVFLKEGAAYFSGTGMNRLMKIDKNGELSVAGKTPLGTHNVQFYQGNLLYNNTASDNIRLTTPSGKLVRTYDLPSHDPASLEHSNLSSDYARASFGRGLYVHNDLILGGSSPSTISVYNNDGLVKSVNITKDIRNATHGLAVYPY